MSLQFLSQPDQVRVQRLAEHLLQLGPRSVAEALAEALAYGDLGRLERYHRLTPALLDAASPPRPFPLHLVAANQSESDGQAGAHGGSNFEVA